MDCAWDQDLTAGEAEADCPTGECYLQAPPSPEWWPSLPPRSAETSTAVEWAGEGAGIWLLKSRSPGLQS